MKFREIIKIEAIILATLFSVTSVLLFLAFDVTALGALFLFLASVGISVVSKMLIFFPYFIFKEQETRSHSREGFKKKDLVPIVGFIAPLVTTSVVAYHILVAPTVLGITLIAFSCIGSSVILSTLLQVLVETFSICRKGEKEKIGDEVEIEKIESKSETQESLNEKKQGIISDATATPVSSRKIEQY